MKVLMATTASQGERLDDYSWTVEGELVHLPLFDCCTPGCGCDRGFAGLSSAKATTTAMVVDRRDLCADDVSIALIDALTRQGWLEPGWSEDNAEYFADVWAQLERVTAHFDDGDVIERHGDLVRRRSNARLHIEAA